MSDENSLGLYGLWMDEDIPYDGILAKLHDVLDSHYQKYEGRVFAIYEITKDFIEEICAQYPVMENHIFINHANLTNMVGKYINDIVHYKIWHEIETANQSKVISHTIKWIIFYPPLTVKVDKEEYFSLNDEERDLLQNINTVYINAVMSYFFDKFDKAHLVKEPQKYRKIFYLLQTAQYDARNATLFFDSLL